jgi:uncharacterized membrane protein YoaK (UPF0700 family)
VLVAAMAIQNAAHRIHLGSAPPSTVMTTTQIMIDLADMIQPRGAKMPGVRTPACWRCRSTSRYSRQVVPLLLSCMRI